MREKKKKYNNVDGMQLIKSAIHLIAGRRLLLGSSLGWLSVCVKMKSRRLMPWLLWLEL